MVKVLQSPGKIFILGEYAVLAGLPAVVAAIGPRFGLFVSDEGDEGHPFADGSPAARLVSWARGRGARGLDLRFEDPHGGEGGFGASTAAFALAYRAFAESEGWDCGWQAVWTLYRDLSADSRGGFRPSGADLVSQWRGGSTLFVASEQRASDAWPAFGGSRVLVFSAAGIEGRKVATHSHLEALKDAGRDAAELVVLKGPLGEGISALSAGDAEAFGRSLGSYADALSRLGLEDDRARADREAFAGLAGVAGAKGCGAMLSDAILVVLSRVAGEREREEALRLGAARGLRLVCDGLERQAGVA